MGLEYKEGAAMGDAEAMSSMRRVVPVVCGGPASELVWELLRRRSIADKKLEALI